jgi:hypothetical protein
VLEVGAGIGDHSSFFIERDCRVCITEARHENLEALRLRFPDQIIRHLDLEQPDITFEDVFDIVYCYGVLYHLRTPSEALGYLASRCRDIMLIETCVSYGEEEAINLVSEDANSVTQSVSGIGCRPTRPWVFKELRRHFDWVYMPVTQPRHSEFPLDWSRRSRGLMRSVFVASRQELKSELLLPDVPRQQMRLDARGVARPFSVW